MMYFKFTDKEGNEIYGAVNADKDRIDLNKLRDFLHAKMLL